ncbi:MAG: hypothetical protein WBA74_07705, partial [Cyclobacteriaceae bacterium]
MKRILIATIALLCSFISSQAQTRYEPGYIIDNSGERQSVLIKNTGWQVSPDKISYVTTNDPDIKVLGINDIKEFGLEDQTIFRKFITDVDQSSKKVGNLSVKRAPEYASDTLFLRLLVDSKVSLYSYSDGSGYKFFYQDGNDQPVELI